MAHESFEDEQVAAYLNEHYVAIKVDREERPDIDHVYMMFCQALTGEGGWPLTVIMTPDAHPFFAGTYFPKTARYGRPGVLDILQTLHERWETDGARMRAASVDVTKRLQPIFASSPGAYDADAALSKAANALTQRFDEQYGGFGDAPKFPSFHQLLFLLRYNRFTGDKEALQMALHTLEAIQRGGIYDHVGGGFSRYSTDMFWRVPHFEKMLYDNALAVLTYAEAFQQSGNVQFRRVIHETLTYILREMTSPEGGFYAAQDADSEGQEGRFYVWRPDEVIAALEEPLGQLYCAFYDITEEGNFEGDSVPNYIDTDVDAFAAARGLTVEELQAKLAEANERLLEWRAHRVHPDTDDKVLTAWNALLIAALAKAGAVLGNAEYVGMAVRAVSFLEAHLVDGNGRLLARYRDGEAGILAYADDYAYLVWAYITIYETTLDPFYLHRAEHWQKQMDALFWDEADHGYFLTGHDANELIARPKTVYDGATPSANSVAAYNLAQLYAITGRSAYADKVEQIFQAFGEVLGEAPTEHLHMLSASLWVHGGSTEVVVASGNQGAYMDEILKAWHARYLPEAVLLTPKVRVDGEEMYPAQSDELRVYVCRQFRCEQPEQDWRTAFEKLFASPPRLRTAEE